MTFAPGRMPPPGAKPSALDRAAVLAFPQDRRRELQIAAGLAAGGLVVSLALPPVPASTALLIMAGETLSLAVIIGTVGTGLLGQQQNTARAYVMDGREIGLEVQELLRQYDLATAPPTPTEEELAARADLEVFTKNFRARPLRALVGALNGMDAMWARWERMVQNHESEMLPDVGLHLVTDHWMKEVKEQLDRTWAALETGAATLTALGAVSAGLRRIVALVWVLVALLAGMVVTAVVPPLGLPLALAGGYLAGAGIIDAVSTLLADKRAFDYDVTLG